MKRWISILLMAALSLGACNKSLAPQETAAIEQTVNSQNYTFNVESVNPAGGRNIPMSPGYDLQVSQGAVIATLPYFGRAYYPPLDPNQGGFRFTSHKFRYSATQTDKGAWDILIVPEDVAEVQELRLSITADGYATLYVTSANRQAISYYGQVLKTKVANPE